MSTSASADVVIVGAGLAGGLLALALRDHAISVAVVDGAGELAADPTATSTAISSATAISYGALPGWPLGPSPLARMAAGASRQWQRLERRHGPLGWRPSRLRLHGERVGLGPASVWLPLPFAQVDSAVLAARLPQALAAAGVQRLCAWVERLQPQPAGRWQLQLSDGTSLQTSRLVLAAGAHCRQLWPALPQRLRSSWAAVLELSAGQAQQALAERPGGSPWVRRPVLRLPARFARVDLERRAAELRQPEWLVDGGLVPQGAGALLGQHTLVRPGLELGAPPEAAAVQQQLRQALAAQPWAVALAGLPGQLRQAAVAFSASGLPLVGPAAETAGLWVFTGFSAGFSQVPVLAPLLAQAIAAPAPGAEAAERRLRQLGVWGAAEEEPVSAAG